MIYKTFKAETLKQTLYNKSKHSPGGVSTVIQKHKIIEMLSFFRNGTGTNLIKLADDIGINSLIVVQ